MKKVFKATLSFFAVTLIIALSALNCFAKGALTLDGDVRAGKGDTFSYTLYLADCEKPVTSIVAYLFYDSEYLQLDKESIDFHELVGVGCNSEIDGVIPFTFSTLSSPVDFSERTPIVSLDFKVIKEGKSSVKYFIGDLNCGTVTDNSPAKEFTFSCDYDVHSADGDDSFENLSPILIDDKEQLDKYQSDFTNYADGKGSQSEGGENHIAVTGEVQGEVTDVTKDADNNTAIIITVAVVVIILIIAILIVLRRAFSQKDNKDDDEKADSADDN